MKQRRKVHKRSVQGHSLLYGRSSKAIHIVKGEKVGRVVYQHHSTKNNSRTEKQMQKNYKMDKSIEERLDKLQDPLEMMNRTARTQKYEAAKSSEKYEYGISDW